MFLPLYLAALVIGLVGLRLAGPARNRDLYLLPVLATAAFIATLAALAASLLH
ncbi:hypothetical protein [Streptomyces sp. NPDC090026]|uniref:hypothetical protein n=1 Tax=Streptomyces sp. NPDC090026 TaxID=3365923 RepID=UPI00381601F0